MTAPGVDPHPSLGEGAQCAVQGVLTRRLATYRLQTGELGAVVDEVLAALEPPVTALLVASRRAERERVAAWLQAAADAVPVRPVDPTGDALRALLLEAVTALRTVGERPADESPH